MFEDCAAHDQSGKRKASSSPDVPPLEVDVAALQQHMRAVGEKRSKAREDVRRVHMPKSRDLSRHGSPMAKRCHVIEVKTSEEATKESEHIRGMNE